MWVDRDICGKLVERNIVLVGVVFYTSRYLTQRTFWIQDLCNFNEKWYEDTFSIFCLVICVHCTSQRPLRSWKFFLTRRPEIKAKLSRMINEARKVLKQKFSLGEMALFLIFLKKNWKKCGKKFPKKIFFFTKICFSELEKAYVQLFVLNFFLSRS